MELYQFEKMTFVSFATAKLLKELRADITSFAHYNEEGKIAFNNRKRNNYLSAIDLFWLLDRKLITAPTQEQVLAWLREKEHYIFIRDVGDDRSIYFQALNSKLGKTYIATKSYELAIEEAILATLKHLKNQTK